MRTNWVRERLQAGKPTAGCFMGLGSPLVAELLAHAGYDWLSIEMEHNGLDFGGVQQMIMAINATDCIPIARIPSSEPTYIQRALDIGAMGILVPMVRSVEEAEAIVAMTRYPPAGKRSFGPLRASNYTIDYEGYFAGANDNTLVVLMLETREAFDDFEAICAVPGVDAVYAGRFDLSLSLGLNPMQEDSIPPIEEALERALAIGRENGVAMGYGCGSAEELRMRVEQGFTFLCYATDYNLIADTALDRLNAVSDILRT
ncbi:MAG: aldolase/citrate lyase family protein [Caldilineaceae bacterium]|nr:aldolase/citrate lyase family protein [Caldilineaceae bacterium]MCY4092157.1 aldolase/citrate lyase family protein [Caldilineaceae bacterium]MCY4116968.1 aldolase/citrate lyase family protein [Caldilineaceae bacterium]MDE0430141.1 aldolase/citrate lyase family protein [Caldilineaceae bacterium]